MHRLDYLYLGRSRNAQWLDSGKGLLLASLMTAAALGCGAQPTATPDTTGDNNAQASGLDGTQVPFRWLGGSHDPVFAYPPGGIYKNGPTVHVASPTPGVQIFVTTDGTNPKNSATRQQVTDTIKIDTSTLLKMTALYASGRYSDVEDEIYIVTRPPRVDPLPPGAVDRPQIGALGRVKVPMPKQLPFFVKDKGAAIALGKALFWDQQVGSDGVQACASCHFNAGADSRSKNQVNQGTLATDDDGNPIPPVFKVGGGGPNLQLTPANYPFHRLSDPNDRHSDVLFDTMNTTSSQGVYMSNFLTIFAGVVPDLRDFVSDPVFNVANLTVRRVEPRNTPTMINAVFNYRNFWDGRAQFEFNGMNPFGDRDPALDDAHKKSGFLVRARNGKLMKTHVLIDNSSLASQAVGPVLSPFEMSAGNRTFPAVGYKMLAPSRVPLYGQDVAADDSVLGPYVAPGGQGLKVGYADLVRAAFREEWWNAPGFGIKANADGTADIVPWSGGGFDVGEYTPMEWNFSLFWGLAVQLYEATLIADETPFDQFMSGDDDALTEQQQRGLVLFQGKGHCSNCHGGPEFTNASVANVQNQKIERMEMGDGNLAVYDDGFYNIGVRKTHNDIGVGGLDPFGNPLSMSRLSQDGDQQDRNVTVDPHERVAVDGAFKAPGLRNVELTAPYFHNGGQLTLRQVVQFYNRGGDFADENKKDLDPDIENRNMTEHEIDDLVAFLKSLTDERVRYQKAPFDHPSLLLSNGHPIDQFQVVPDPAMPIDAMDYGAAEKLKIPAVGAGGSADPQKKFLE